MQSYITINQVNDAQKLLSFKLDDESHKKYFQYDTNNLGLSYKDTFPSRWRIAGVSIFRNLNRQVTDRNIYGFLNYLGDIGGLQGILLLTGKLFAGAYFSFTANEFFLTKLYHNKPNYKGSVIKQDIVEDFSSQTNIETSYLLNKIICRGKKRN